MQRANHAWVAEAADRAEKRLHGVAIRKHATPLEELQSLIGAIMDPRVSRAELRRLVKSISGEGKP